MSLSNIENLTANMTNPDTIIRSMNVTNLWGEYFIYGLMLVVVFALEYHLDKFSKRLSVAGFLGFIMALGFYSVDFITKTSFLRIIFVLVLSIIWLFMETMKSQ